MSSPSPARATNQTLAGSDWVSELGVRLERDGRPANYFGEETGVQVREDATTQAEQETDVGDSTLWSMRRPARKASTEETVAVVAAESVAASAFLRGAAFGGAIWGRVGDRSG
uniref:Uncharacterized protein n=1 Tax=Oryza barthii TaxID=65489 RepID=A0A0D3HB27_9ORYZ